MLTSPSTGKSPKRGLSEGKHASRFMTFPHFFGRFSILLLVIGPDQAAFLKGAASKYPNSVDRWSARSKYWTRVARPRRGCRKAMRDANNTYFIVKSVLPPRPPPADLLVNVQQVKHWRGSFRLTRKYVKCEKLEYFSPSGRQREEVGCTIGRRR